MKVTNMRPSPTFILSTVSSLLLGIAIGWFSRRRRKFHRKLPLSANSSAKLTAYESLIGDTPCILLPNLSQILRRQIYVKLENHNPGGTGKDRAAWSMIRAAERSGLLPKSKDIFTLWIDLNLHPKIENSTSLSSATESTFDNMLWNAVERSVTGGVVIEGTSGSTGISLAAIAIANGHTCIVVLPDDQATEKKMILQSLGAMVHVVPTAAISNPQHYVNMAKSLARRAVELGIAAVFVDQFNNLENYRIHYATTGPEIWDQCQPQAFVMSAGTGGTIAGVAQYLKERNPQCRVVLADPVGSVLYAKVQHGVAFTCQQKEASLRRHRYDTIAEGIGLDRITQNVHVGLPYIDGAITVSDQDMVEMAHFILQQEGLMLGSSSATNLVAAVQTAMQLPEHSRICTVICDSGQRHVTRFWNRDFILSRGLQWPSDNIHPVRPKCLQELVQ
jgi:cysteine synthase